MRRLDLRLIRVLDESGCISLVSHLQQLAVLFRLAIRHFLTEVYTLTLGLQWSKLVEIGQNSEDMKWNEKNNTSN